MSGVATAWKEWEHSSRVLPVSPESQSTYSPAEVRRLGVSGVVLTPKAISTTYYPPNAGGTFYGGGQVGEAVIVTSFYEQSKAIVEQTKAVLEQTKAMLQNTIDLAVITDASYPSNNTARQFGLAVEQKHLAINNVLGLINSTTYQPSFVTANLTNTNEYSFLVESQVGNVLWNNIKLLPQNVVGLGAAYATFDELTRFLSETPAVRAEYNAWRDVVVINGKPTVVDVEYSGDDSSEFNDDDYFVEWETVFPERVARTESDLVGRIRQLEREIEIDEEFREVAHSAVQDAADFATRYLHNENPIAMLDDDGVVILQWRGTGAGVMLMFRGSGAASYSVKEKGGSYIGTSMDFDPQKGLPDRARYAIELTRK